MTLTYNAADISMVDYIKSTLYKMDEKSSSSKSKSSKDNLPYCSFLFVDAA